MTTPTEEPVRIEVDLALALKQLQDDPDLAKRLNEAAFGEIAANEIQDLYVELENRDTEIEKLRGLLRRLLTHEHVDFDRIAYQVRDSEGEGWDGPSVTSFSELLREITAAAGDLSGQPPASVEPAVTTPQ